MSGSGQRFTTGDIRDPYVRRLWPSFAELTACVNPRQRVGLFATAPWFCPNGLDDEELMEHYYVAGVTPDGLPRRALNSRDWRYHCYLPDRAVVRRRVHGRLQSIEEARRALTTRIYQRLARMGGTYPIPPEYGFDTWTFRCPWEAQYGQMLANVLQRADDWRGHFVPSNEHLAFPRPYLVSDFRYLGRFTADDSSANYRRLVRWERFQRARTGYLIPYQMLEADNILDAEKAERYVKMPGMWHDWEVPKGLWVELPPVLTYAWSRLLNDPASGVWPVLYAEWCAVVACAWLWEAYDTFRLFWLPGMLIANIRRLNLNRVLGSPCNGRDLSHLLGIVERAKWADVPAEQRLRVHPVREGVVDFAVTGRDDAGGDWLCYDPWERETLDDDARRERLKNKPSRPSDHPKGVRYTPDDVPSGETLAQGRAMDCSNDGDAADAASRSVSEYEDVAEGTADDAGAARAAAKPRQPGDLDVSSSASSFARQCMAKLDRLDLGAGMSAGTGGTAPAAPEKAKDNGSPVEAEGSTITAILRSAGLISADTEMSPTGAIALLKKLQQPSMALTPAASSSNAPKEAVADNSGAPSAASGEPSTAKVSVPRSAPVSVGETISEPVAGSGESGPGGSNASKGN